LLFGSDGLSLESLSELANGGVEFDRFSRRIGQSLAHRSLGEGSVVSAFATEHGLLLVGITGGPTGGGSLVVMESPSDRVERSIPVCSAQLRAVHFWEAGRRIYAACADDSLVEIDADLWIPLRHEPIPGQCDPRGVTMSASGTIVMVLCGNGRFLYLDRVPLAALDSMSVGVGGSDFTRTPDGRQALIAFPQSNEITVVDLHRRSIVARIPAERPRGIVMDGDGRAAYLLAGTPGTQQEILTIDLDRLAIAARTPAPRDAQALAVWPGRWSPAMRWEE
jgi:DNA-binding beta-propeller fold protein YncE